MFLALTPEGQGMDTNTMIFLSVYFIYMVTVLIPFIKYKR
jgi:hypothetical protein